MPVSMVDMIIYLLMNLSQTDVRISDRIVVESIKGIKDWTHWVYRGVESPFSKCQPIRL